MSHPVPSILSQYSPKSSLIHLIRIQSFRSSLIAKPTRWELEHYKISDILTEPRYITEPKTVGLVP